jgi:hypothetical protein
MPRPEITGRKLRTHRHATAASRDEEQGEEDQGHEGGGGEQDDGNHSEPGALDDPYLNANQVKHRYGDRDIKCSEVHQLSERLMRDDGQYRPRKVRGRAPPRQTRCRPRLCRSRSPISSAAPPPASVGEPTHSASTGGRLSKVERRIDDLQPTRKQRLVSTIRYNQKVSGAGYGDIGQPHCFRLVAV